jgi:hypothetical protein
MFRPESEGVFTYGRSRRPPIVSNLQGVVPHCGKQNEYLLLRSLVVFFSMRLDDFQSDVRSGVTADRSSVGFP